MSVSKRAFGLLVARRWPDAKAPGSALRYETNFLNELARLWSPGEVSVGLVIRAGAYDAECMVAGRTGRYEQRWPQLLGESVEDGSARWRIVEPSASSYFATVDTFVWTPSAGITVDDQLDGPLWTSAVLAGGVKGREYELVVRANLSNGEHFDQPCILEVA